MYNFKYEVGTKIFFGRNQIVNIGKEIKMYSDKVLIVYGGGSIKKNGIFDATIEQLRINNIEYFELGGVDPNPRIESVREGAKICKEKGINAILAVGGGSSIDCAKAISAATKYDGDAWDIVINKKLIKNAIPVFSILTLAATGSEMNGNSVISDYKNNLKLGTRSPLLIPKASILDPEYTYSVPHKHTAAGTADIISHTFENYFTSEEGGYLQARMAEAILKTCFHYGPIACREPENYEARANLMWASSWAINGLISDGVANNWSVHPMEHELSAFYDVTHGEGLAILTPAWMRYVLNDKTVNKFVEYGTNVWGIDSSLDKFDIANTAIDMTQEFFTKELGIPSSLSELRIDNKYFDKMATQAVRGETIKGFIELTAEDVRKIYESCLL
ncbi:iron-containing alcohol dehydrogenase [Peptostreptococcus canis]|uniref:Iron-containing alcohol dehydrogenase n=1 Tax=Peptostreptococcus canis TaxID=1159213 RepID=A0ABR6TKN9_9FIRM|nr:iron-containing alcohol dehydrogenase [Peptostreptococcus canis]MBC2575754.1 iron-containing alcohol dehydrogenase [Peptostreptococcus canis]MBP1998131.1 alcohol dehydrogenase YqhD (iron-dependent ADH family) [Peptostreptococcus canis]